MCIYFHCSNHKLWRIAVKVAICMKLKTNFHKHFPFVYFPVCFVRSFRCPDAAATAAGVAVAIATATIHELQTTKTLQSTEIARCFAAHKIVAANS